jgi:acetolactate synthase-1/2/3 large subunit
MLFLGGDALRAGPLADAHRIAAATGAQVMAETFCARMERGRGRFAVDRLPYNVEPGLAALAGIRHLILVGAYDPVAFFAYPDMPGRFAPPEAKVMTLTAPGEDSADTLRRLADRLAAPRLAVPERKAPAPATGAITQATVGQTLAALLPEDAVVVEEGVTFGFGLYPPMADAAPHDYLRLVGGAIGDGLPLATGAAVGAPGRRVIGLQADGSALYTVQALWTQARERLDITTVILSNRRYAILDGELAAVGAAPGPASRALFDLGNPDMDWVRIANGFGVEAARAATIESFADVFAHANSRPGPFLIELVIP